MSRVCCSLAFFILAVAGPIPFAREAEAAKLKVLTSFLPLYCFTVNVAGDLAEVQNLLPARVEPHDYQLSRKDLQKLSHADLIVLNGLGLESWLNKALAVQGLPQVVVQIANGLESDLIFRSAAESTRQASAWKKTWLQPASVRWQGDGTFPNPHIWLDPRLAGHAITNILKALQEADPGNASGYAANAARYLARLEKLDSDLRQALTPVRGASIVTSHDAFPYFARRYDLHIVGVVEPVPDVEPSLKYLARLYGTIREGNVDAIFTEATSASRLARQIGCDLGIPVAQLDTLEAGPLTATAYEDGMRKNLAVLLKHLKPTSDAQRTQNPKPELGTEQS